MIQKAPPAAGLNYGTMRITAEVVTPSIAANWLERNIGNRRLREGVAEQYARDMIEDNWHRKPLAICFDEEGNLGNGQHTLTAIVRSGKTQELLVARSVPRLVIALMDRGCQRSVADIANFVGENLDKHRAATAKVTTFGQEGLAARNFSFSELLEMYTVHKRVIEDVLASGGGRGRHNSIVCAVCSRAAYTESLPKITEFLDVVGIGVAHSETHLAAIRLRDLMGSKAHNGASSRRELYAKAQSALRAFLDGKPMMKLYGVEGDIFPVPAT